MRYMRVTIEMETHEITRENFNEATLTAAKKMLEHIQTVDGRARLTFVSTDQTPQPYSRQYLNVGEGK